MFIAQKLCNAALNIVVYHCISKPNLEHTVWLHCLLGPKPDYLVI